MALGFLEALTLPFRSRKKSADAMTCQQKCFGNRLSGMGVSQASKPHSAPAAELAQKIKKGRGVMS
jgi:hypothetical protein